MDLDKFHNWMRAQALSEKTISLRLRALRHLKKKGLNLDRISWKRRYKIAEFLHEQGYSDAALNNYIRAVNMYLRFKQWDFKLKKIPSRGEDDIWVPTSKEVSRILNIRWKTPYLHSRNRLLLKILFIAALRCSEARNLKYGDFRYTVSEAKGLEGEKFYYIFVQKGKGRKKRSVDIPKDLYDDLMLFNHYYRGSTEYVFENGRGLPVSDNTVRKICKEAGKAADVPRFHPHSARHWRALDLYDKGVKPQAIQRFLGHSSITTTYTYFRGRKRQETRLEIIQNDPETFGGLSGKIKNAKTSNGADTNEVQ